MGSQGKGGLRVLSRESGDFHFKNEQMKKMLFGGRNEELDLGHFESEVVMRQASGRVILQSRTEVE
jgi:hypothetical protein